MQSRSLFKNSNGPRGSVAAGVCLALIIGCSSTAEPPSGNGGQTATGGTQGVAGTSGGKGGSTTGTGGSSGTTGSGGSGGSTSASGGAGAGGRPGGAGTGGASGSSFTLGGHAGSAGSTGGAPMAGSGGSSPTTGGAPGSGGTSAGSSAQGGRMGTGGASAGGTPGAGAGGTSGSGGNFDPCPTTSDPCKILPLGDSITFGIQYAGAYRVEVFHKSLGDSKNITFVGSQMNGPSMVDSKPFPQMHEGHSGYTIDQMQPFAMTTDVPFMPNIILLHIGTNDTYGSDPTGAPMRLQTLTDLILTTYPNTLLVVAKIIPYPSQAANTKIINDSIPDLVNSRAMQGKHIAMADCNTGFMTSSMLSSDSIHPNQTGYNFMGDQFYAVISPYLH